MHSIQKILKVSLIGVATLFFMNISLAGQDIEVKMEDGIPVVYNPKEPVQLPNTASKLTLEEDLMLGEPDEDQNYPFSMLSWLCVDDEGRTYVRTYEKANPGEYVFDVFDSQADTSPNLPVQWGKCRS